HNRVRDTLYAQETCPRRFESIGRDETPSRKEATTSALAFDANDGDLARQEEMLPEVFIRHARVIGRRSGIPGRNCHVAKSVGSGACRDTFLALPLLAGERAIKRIAGLRLRENSAHEQRNARNRYNNRCKERARTVRSLQPVHFDYLA